MVSAADAFAAVKVLFPEAISIERGKDGLYVKVEGIDGPRWGSALLNTTGLVDLTYGETYPKPEPKWRKAEWPRDAASPPKEARFKDNEGGWCLDFLVARHDEKWLCGDLCEWEECEVVDDSKV